MLGVLNNYYAKSDKTGFYLKPVRPKTINDARRLIAECFERQGWDEDSQKNYFEMKGIEAERLADVSPDDIRKIVAAMEKSHMLIFAD